MLYQQNHHVHNVLGVFSIFRIVAVQVVSDWRTQAVIQVVNLHFVATRVAVQMVAPPG